uniref:Bm8968 n=1 Tax=Brugia malayi TaxID=6279 RepID=A0A1I9G0G1_BRUMA|nr:Bm8968 [Brugia malayi]
MMQLTEVISNLTKRRTTGSDDSTTANNNEQEDMDEFVDAVDVFYEESESDIYDDNVQCIVAENDDMIEKDEILHELGLMLNSTLASDYDGANVARLNAHFL